MADIDERRDDNDDEVTDERRHLGDRAGNDPDNDIRFDTGIENRMINEPSRSVVAHTVPDDIAKEAARAKYAEEREGRETPDDDAKAAAVAHHRATTERRSQKDK